MATPGLLPEAEERRLSPLSWLPWLICLVLFFVVMWQSRREPLVIERTLPAPTPPADPRVRELEAKIEELRKSTPPAPLPATAVAPARAPDVRILPPEQGAERLTQGLHEFRSGRYERAEALFFRAIPEGYLYLALCGWTRGELRDAALFLARAMAADPAWLRRVRPADLFGSREEYEKALKALEERVRENPLDPDAKLMLAYLHYHEKGPEYAKALLTELATAQPDAPAPKAFLQAVDQP